MLNFFSLPEEIRLIILSKIPSALLYDWVDGKINETQILPALGFDLIETSQSDRKKVLKDFLSRARFELFKRRGGEVSPYQERLLKAWLTDWAAEKQLPFMVTPEDKQSWSALLCDDLDDPDHSFAHKIRCSILIDKIQSWVQVVPQGIVGKMILDIPKTIPSPLMIESLSSEFSKDNIQQIITALTAILNASDRNWLTRITHGLFQRLDRTLYAVYTTLVKQYPQVKFEAAARALGAIAPYASVAQCDLMIDLLCGKLHEQFWDSFTCLVEVLLVILPHASPARRLQLIDFLVAQEGITTQVAPLFVYLSETQKERMVQSFLLKLNPDADVSLDPVFRALSVIADHLSSEQADAIFTALITHSKKIFIPDLDLGIALSRIAPHTSLALYRSFKDSFSDTSGDLLQLQWKFRLIHSNVIALLGGDFSSDDIDTLISDLLNPNDPTLDDLNRALRYRTLSTLGPYHSVNQGDQIMEILLAGWGNHPNLRRVITFALHALAPYASKRACDSMVPLIVLQIKHDDTNWYLIDLLRIIGSRFPQTELNLIGPALISRLDGGDAKVRETAMRAIIPFVPSHSRSLLKQLNQSAGELNLERMMVELILKARLSSWCPEKDYGMSFSKKAPHIISQSAINPVNKTWYTLRSLQLWSHPKAVDDCFSEVPHKNKRRFHEN